MMGLLYLDAPLRLHTESRAQLHQQRVRIGRTAVATQEAQLEAHAILCDGMQRAGCGWRRGW